MLKTLIFLCLFSQFAFSSELSFYDYEIKQFWRKGTDATSLQILLAGTTATLLSRPNDDHFSQTWKDQQKMNTATVDFGDQLGSGVPSVLIVGFQYWLDQNKFHSDSHLRSIVWNTLIVQTMKFSIGRPRPGESENRQSFPSGHSAVSFATATSLTYAYGWKAAVITYPLATFVAATRVAKNTHWFSDVVAGAFIGYWVGRAGFYSVEEADDLNATSYTIFPTLGPESTGLGLVYSF